MKFKKRQQLHDSDMQLHMIYAYEELVEEPWSLNVLGVTSKQDEINEKISELTEEFADIFTEPKGLPPFRMNHNHKIVLKERAEPVNQRLYRYDVYQKNEVDKMVNEFLQAGTVQPSSYAHQWC